jgi:CDP-diacylglycerol---glycerol-3-phosphate 3-phosphatidyltransferase
MFALIPNDERGSWIAFGMWFVLCMSDGIDGYLARRHGTTSSGAFLDPLADKVLVLGAMFTLVRNDMFWWLPVALIAGRELVISVYRTFVGSQGVSVPASKLGKWKTFVQQLAVGFALWPWFAVDAKWLWVGLLWLAVALSLAAGAVPLARDPPAQARGRFPRPGGLMRCDVVAVGTELLLGQIVDTNSAWIGEHLAASGIDSLLQVKVGDNVGRIVAQLAAARRRRRRDRVRRPRPTHDDLTREAIAAVMGPARARRVGGRSDPRDVRQSARRRMPDNNLRQALVPVGARSSPRRGGRRRG